MKSKVTIIGLSIVTVIAVIIGIIFLVKNVELKKKQITIIDASMNCRVGYEKIYEDDNYTYSLPCIKSSAIFVKFPDNTKIQVTKALEEEKVTIGELIKAGLEIIKEEK